MSSIIPGTLHEVLYHMRTSASLLPKELEQIVVPRRNATRKRARESSIRNTHMDVGTIDNQTDADQTTSNKVATAEDDSEPKKEEEDPKKGLDDANDIGDNDTKKTSTDETKNGTADRKNDPTDSSGDNDTALPTQVEDAALVSVKRARTACQEEYEAQTQQHQDMLQKIHGLRAMYLHGLEQVSSLTDMRKAPDAYLASL